MSTASNKKCSEDTKPPETPTVRHCAYCLKEAIGMKTCSRCHKRAYCSSICQAIDWSPKKDGQGHKKWCTIECGEEDIDWKIQEIPGKGLGIVALRDIPAKTRIMVDRGYTPDEARKRPQVMDLHPPKGSIETKLMTNKIGTNFEGAPLICIRLSRTNHACVANADHRYDPQFKVFILFSDIDIKAGEEITISYITHRDIALFHNRQAVETHLFFSGNIICPQDCACRDPATWLKVKEAQDLSVGTLNMLARQEYKDAYLSFKRILELYNELKVGLKFQLPLYERLFDLCNKNRETVTEGFNYLQEALKIEKCLEPHTKNSWIEQQMNPRAASWNLHQVPIQRWF